MKRLCKRFIAFTIIIYQNWSNCATVCAKFMQTVAAKNNKKGRDDGICHGQKNFINILKLVPTDQGGDPHPPTDTEGSHPGVLVEVPHLVNQGD